jgi:immune inhibitor A
LPGGVPQIPVANPWVWHEWKETALNGNEKWVIGGVVGALLLCVCLGAACLGLGGLAVFNFQRIGSQVMSQITPEVLITRIATLQGFSDLATQTPQSTETLENPVVEGTPNQEPTPLAMDTQSPTNEGAQQTLNTLEKAIVPINDPRDLARRLEGKQNIPDTLEAPKTPPKIGNQQSFWALNNETAKNYQVKATLQYVTGHLYFYIENDVSFDQGELKRLCETFENKLYPTDREFFGSEWSPGIDGDVHLYVLYARGLGNGIAGYFSSKDELPPQASQYSNAHEMFMLNADVIQLGDEYTYVTMAHEFQHMIHWNLDRNESSWLNEGFSVLAELLNGYDNGGFDALYISNPDLQLTYWPSPPESSPHYGQAFLFLAYFLDRFGDKATQAVVANVDNSLDSIDKVLASLKETEPKTGKVIQADDVFADWAVGLFLNDPNVGDGRFAYKRYTEAAKPQPTEEINDCPPDWQQRTVHQYGIDYIKISCSGNVTLRFQGTTEVGVLPVDAHSGSYAFWSNKGDESDMTLTHVFDFTQAKGPLTLKYSTWYDLEKDYDYAYLDVSEDGGTSWQILKTPSGRDKTLDPSGNAYGWGYTDQSNGWKEESVDLSQYAGKKVQIRFEYITDSAVNGEGFLVDDISIPQINYSTDFEKEDGGWQGDGFVRIQNRLPQLFRVSLIEEGTTISVQYINLDANQSASIPLKFDGEMNDAVLVVSGVTRFTNQEAQYQFSFQK